MSADSTPTPPLRLRTPRLELIAGDAWTARADADGDRARLAELLNAAVPPEWPPELTLDVLEFFASTLAARPAEVGWWGWFIVRDAAPDAARVLVGGAGFKGPPTSDGTVEIGYSVLPAFQRHGYATEALRALLDWCFGDSRVQRVVGETFPELTASRRVMAKLGMAEVGPGNEPGTVQAVLRRADRTAVRLGEEAVP